MTRFRARRVLLAATAVVAGSSAIAIASEPSSGTISSASPSIAWTGSTTGSYWVLNPMNNAPEDVPCEQPTCDTFALTLADQGTLTVAKEIETDSETATAGIRVTFPDGTVLYANGPSSTGKPLKSVIKNAKPGDYTIDLINNFVAGATYKGSASLPVAAAPAPAPTAAPAPGATPPPSGQPATRTDFKLSVKVARKLSSRKLRKGRKLTAAVKVSSPVTSMTAKLLKGRKTVATGSLGQVAKSAKLGLKLKSNLKKGSYSLVVTATNSENTSVTKIVKLKVKR